MPTISLRFLARPIIGPMFKSLSNRNYRWFMFSNIAQNLGFMMQQFTMAWLLLELTGSVSKLGIMVFLQGLPMMGALFLVGVVADRMSRLKLLVISQIFLMLNMLILGLVTLNGSVTLGHLYAAAIVAGIGRGFNAPTRLTMIRDLVARQDVMNAVSLNFTLMTTSMLFGPIVAGPMIEWVGLAQALIVAGACYLTASLILITLRGVSTSSDRLQVDPIRGAQNKTQLTGKRRAFLNFPITVISTVINVYRDLMSGMRYMMTVPSVFAILVLGFAIAFFGQPVMQLLPAFGKEVLELGPVMTSMLLAIMAAGSVVGNLALASMGNPRNKIRLFLSAILLFCVSLGLFSISPWIGPSLIFLFLVGMGTLTFVSMGTTILQLMVPQTMLGRVMGMWTMGASFVSLGALPIAILGDAIGMRSAFATGAIICFVFLLYFGVVKSSIRNAKIDEDIDQLAPLNTEHSR